MDESDFGDAFNSDELGRGSSMERSRAVDE